MVPVPNVAELPTAQKIAHGVAPSISWTTEPVAVVRLVPIWKMNKGLVAPSPVRVRTPVRLAEVSKQ